MIDTPPTKIMKPTAKFSSLRRDFNRLFGRPSVSNSINLWNKSLLLAAIGSVMLALLTAVFDETIMRYVLTHNNNLLSFMASFTNVGLSQWYLVPAAIIFVFLLTLNWSQVSPHARVSLALLTGQLAFLFCAIALSGILANILKIVIGRSRPKLIELCGAWHFEPFTTGYLNASLPSGHATTMGALAAVLIIWFPKLRLLIFPACIFGAVTRVAAQAHYPSDVVSGFAFGFIYSLLLARWLASKEVIFQHKFSNTIPSLRWRG